MKNLFLLPTDKPSRLYLFEERLILGDLVTVVFKNSGAVNQNIYITEDVKIRTRGWYIYDNEIYCNSIDEIHSLNTNVFKKIILTTDKDLIKDGVQAIDDEFLEWFVKNPSCEEVEVVSAKTIPALQLTGNGHCWWKIIIPKEELDYTALLQPVGTKQETLEEIVNKLSIKEAKDLDLFLKGIEWQQERSYSEEDMLKMLHKFGFDYTYNYKGEKTIYEWIPEWFEEYKSLNNLKTNKI
jgi:hypothetical protein